MTLTAGEAVDANAGKRRCTATSKTTGERCRLYAKPNMAVCGLHGANGTSKRKAAAWQAVDELMPFYNPDAPPITDPVATLQRWAGIVDNMADVAGQKVNELESWESYDVKGTVAIRGTMQVLLQVMRMAESFSTTLAKLGIDERKVQIAERDQQLIITALRAIMSDPELALTAGQRQAWESVVPRHLKAILASAEST